MGENSGYKQNKTTKAIEYITTPNRHCWIWKLKTSKPIGSITTPNRESKYKKNKNKSKAIDSITTPHLETIAIVVCLFLQCKTLRPNYKFQTRICQTTPPNCTICTMLPPWFTMLSLTHIFQTLVLDLWTHKQERSLRASPTKVATLQTNMPFNATTQRHLHNEEITDNWCTTMALAAYISFVQSPQDSTAKHVGSPHHTYNFLFFRKT